jgi:membrane-bound inhibitor of C-type lysozyme
MSISTPMLKNIFVRTNSIFDYCSDERINFYYKNKKENALVYLYKDGVINLKQKTVIGWYLSKKS